MEYLGQTFETPSRSRSGKWKMVEIVFDDTEDFNRATSKVMRMMYKENSDGKCIVSDADGNRYIMENIHVTFDTYGNTIRLFPIECRMLKN